MEGFDSMKDNKNVKVVEKIGSEVVCKCCGKSFEKKYKRHCYCSDECRLEMTRLQWRIRTKRYEDKQRAKRLAEKQQQLEQDVDTTTDTNDTTEMESDN